MPCFIVHVFVHVKPDRIENFNQATLENARNSVLEPGIARIDVVHQLEDPTRFILVEKYTERLKIRPGTKKRRITRSGGIRWKT